MNMARYLCALALLAAVAGCQSRLESYGGNPPRLEKSGVTVTLDHYRQGPSSLVVRLLIANRSKGDLVLRQDRTAVRWAVLDIGGTKPVPVVLLWSNHKGVDQFSAVWSPETLHEDLTIHAMRNAELELRYDFPTPLPSASEPWTLGLTFSSEAAGTLGYEFRSR
jgi:hypothetical protein